MRFICFYHNDTHVMNKCTCRSFQWVSNKCRTQKGLITTILLNRCMCVSDFLTPVQMSMTSEWPHHTLCGSSWVHTYGTCWGFRCSWSPLKFQHINKHNGSAKGITIHDDMHNNTSLYLTSSKACARMMLNTTITMLHQCQHINLFNVDIILLNYRLHTCIAIFSCTFCVGENLPQWT